MPASVEIKQITINNTGMPGIVTVYVKAETSVGTGEAVSQVKAYLKNSGGTSYYNFNLSQIGGTNEYDGTSAPGASPSAVEVKATITYTFTVSDEEAP